MLWQLPPNDGEIICTTRGSRGSEGQNRGKSWTVLKVDGRRYPRTTVRHKKGGARRGAYEAKTKEGPLPQPEKRNVSSWLKNLLYKFLILGMCAGIMFGQQLRHGNLLSNATNIYNNCSAFWHTVYEHDNNNNIMASTYDHHNLRSCGYNGKAGDCLMYTFDYHAVRNELPGSEEEKGDEAGPRKEGCGCGQSCAHDVCSLCTSSAATSPMGADKFEARRYWSRREKCQRDCTMRNRVFSLNMTKSMWNQSKYPKNRTKSFQKDLKQEVFPKRTEDNMMYWKRLRDNFLKHADEIHGKRQALYERTKAEYFSGSGKGARDGQIYANLWEQRSENQDGLCDKEDKEVSAVPYWKAKAIIQKLEKSIFYNEDLKYCERRQLPKVLTKLKMLKLVFKKRHLMIFHILGMPKNFGK